MADLLQARDVPIGDPGPYNFAYVSTGDVYGLAIAIPVLAIAAVSLRFYVRKDRAVGFGLDDWLLLPALSFFIGVCIILLIGASQNVIGEGVTSPLELAAPKPLHDYTIPPAPDFAKLQFSFQILLILSNCFIKLSTICLYQRIFSTQRHSTFNKFAHASHALVLAWTLAFFLLDVLACPSDPSAQWSGHPSLQAARCTIAFSSGWALTISDFLLDIWLIALPQPLIWRLQMNRSRKLMISGIIVLGMSCVGFSLARVVLYAQIRAAAAAGQRLDRNQVISVNIWFGALDAGVGLIASCLPTIRPLIRDIRNVGKLLSDLAGGTWLDSEEKKRKRSCGGGGGGGGGMGGEDSAGSPRWNKRFSHKLANKFRDPEKGGGAATSPRAGGGGGPLQLQPMKRDGPPPLDDSSMRERSGLLANDAAAVVMTPQTANSSWGVLAENQHAEIV